MIISKLKTETSFIFLTGICCGYILYVLFTECTVKTKNHANIHQIVEMNTMNNSSQSVESVKKIRVLCFLNTQPASHSIKAIHIRKTWKKHCDKLFFASTLTDMNLGAMGLNVTNDHSHLWGKVKLMFQYIHDNHLNDYDWFFKGDDDTFLIPENMKFLLSAYSPEDPIYFGHKFNTTDHKWGYFSGGSGYVLSRKAVRIFVEQLLTNTSLCPVNTDNRVEDWDISVCFDHVNVYAGDGRDLIKRERFLPFIPQQHLFMKPSPWWYFQRKYYYTDEGLDCCSNYTISFHYITPKQMYALYYLTYMHKAFGIKYRFPPPPKRINFANVIERLELERINSSYRGY